MGGGPLAAGAPSHGTTGTMDNPALYTPIHLRLEALYKSVLIDRRIDCTPTVPH